MKKRIFTVLIAILTVIPLVLITPKANTGSTKNGSGLSNYGSYTYQFSTIYENFSVDFPIYGGLGIPISTGSSFTLSYHFNDTYTGYVQFTLNSNTGVGYRLDQCYWGVENGYFKSGYLPSLTNTSSSKDFRIYLYNATEFTFTIVSTNTNTFHPTSTQFTGFGVSSFTYSLSDVADVDDIDRYLFGWDDGNGSSFDGYLPGMSTTLSNIKAALYNGNTSWLSTIHDDLGILSNIGYNTDELEGLLRALEVSTTINIPTYQWSSWIWCSRNDSEFPKFNYNLPYLDYKTTMNNGSFTQNRGIRLSQGQSYSLVFYTNTYISSSNFNIYYQNSNMTANVTFSRVNEVIAGLYAQMITITNTYNGFNYFEPEFNTNFQLYPVYFGNSISIPDDVLRLVGLDYNNTYTRLLESINNGISALNGEYDTSQYDQYEQNIDSLNDSMRNRFNGSETTFQNTINNILTPDQTSGGSNTIFNQFHFNAINGVFTGFLGDLFIAAPLLQYLLLFGLLLLVLGVFI